MRNAIPSFVAFSALAAACGGEDPPQLVDAPTVKEDAAKEDAPVDAPPMFDLSCANNPQVNTAADPVTLAGTANSLTINGITPQVSPLPDADIAACVDDCQDANELATTTSAAAPCGQAGCDFATGAISTGGTPINGYLRVSKATFRTSNIFPSEPIRASLAGVPALAIANNALATLEAVLQVDQDDQNNGLFAVVVTDCALTPVGGATVTVTQNGNAVGEIFDIGQFVAELAGTFLVLNVPAGTATVGASFNGTTFRAHDIESIAGETSATQVTPGFAP